jgi:dienelactone hydrolase
MIKSETVNYRDSDENVFEGVICRDDEISGKRPGVLVVHTYKGQTEFENEKAFELAKSGYVGFAVDLYGKGRRAEMPEEATALMNELNADRPLLLERILLALETLKNHEQVDAEKLGAIGFCFGGKCVLDLARSGADMRGAVSFHGVYDKPPTENDVPIKSSILVLHGWDDPLNTPAQTVELAEELTERKADWQILSFGHTAHAFTNPQANAPEQGLFYNENADRRSWSAMKVFFEEVFA